MKRLGKLVMVVSIATLIDPRIWAEADLDPDLPPPMPGAMTLPAKPIVAVAGTLGYLSAGSDVSPAGAYKYAIPLDVPPGRNGMQPTLSLEYTSGAGNGILGMGFSLAGELTSVISRCGKSIASDGIRDGVDYDPIGPTSDSFCLDGNKLVATNGLYGANGTEYRTEHDIFAQIFSYAGTSSSGPKSFVVKLKSGRTRTYASEGISRYAGNAGGVTTDGIPRYQRWTLFKEEDRSGNSITFTWEQAPTTEDSDGVVTLNYRPIRIDYTGHTSGLTSKRAVVFTYENRRDAAQFVWQSGVKFGNSQRLKTITMSAPSPATTVPVWQYNFSYTTSAFSDRSLLTGVRKCGLPGGTNCSWQKTFQWHSSSKTGVWTQKHIDTQAFGYHPGNRFSPFLYALDVDGDGADELLVQRGTDWANPNVLFYRNLKGAPIIQAAAANGSTFTADQRIDQGLPVDIDNDGRSEMFLTKWIPPETCDDKIVRWDPTYQRFTTQWTMPIDSCGTVNYATRPGVLYDVNGDGLLDFLRTPSPISPSTPNVWAVSFNLGGTFQAAPWPQTSIVRDSTTTRGVDFDGDGRVEIFGMNYYTNVQAIHALDDVGSWATQNDTSNKYPAVKPATPREFNLFADFNGDGLQDYLRVVPPIAYNANTNTYTCPQDPACAWDNGIFVGWLRWNTGNGFGPSKKVQLPDFLSVGGAENTTVRTADVNRDGRQDLVLFTHQVVSASGPTVTDDIRVLVSAGEPSSTTGLVFAKSTIASGAGFWNYPYDYLGAYWRPEEAYPSSVLGDFNGDGFVDIARVLPGTCSYDAPNLATTCPDATINLLLQTPHYGDYLKSVTDEQPDPNTDDTSPAPALWPREVITYSTAISDKPEASAGCAYPKRCVKPGAVVVREVASRAHVVNPPVISPTLPAARTLYYSYEDPVTDLRGRGYLGFRKFRVWDPERPTEQVTEYDNHTAWVSNDGAYPYANRPFRVTTVVPLTPVYHSDISDNVPARVVREITSDILVKLNGDKTYADLPYSYQIDEWEQYVTVDWGVLSTTNPTSEHIYTITPPATTLRAMAGSNVTYDGYGNETSRTDTVVRPGVFNTGNTVTTTTTYDYNFTSSWLVALPRTITVTAKEYSNPSVTVTRTLDYDYEPTGSGRIWHVYRQKNSADLTQRQTFTLSYDAYGNITKTVASTADAAIPVREARIEYAPVWPGQPDERIFVSQVWQPFPTLEYRPSDWVAVHPAYGVVCASMDVNGVKEQATYDQLGRVLSITRPGVATTDIRYSPRVDNYGAYNGMVATATQGGGHWVYRTDALGRLIQSQHKPFDNGNLISEDVVYDTLGRVRYDYRPYQGTQAQAVYKTVWSYDPLDRPLQALLPDNTSITYVHDFWSTSTYDQLGKKKTLERDVNGRIVKSTDFLGGTAATTTYSYLPFDLPGTMTDPAAPPALGHTTTFTYDALGRRTQLVDPDHGTTISTYDGFDQLTRTDHPATGEQTTHLYDSLGRKTRSTGPKGMTVFTWDAPAPAIGKLASATSPDGVLTMLSYDSYGRQTSATQRVGSIDYNIAYAYEPVFGKLQEIRYPSINATTTAGLTVKYTYSSHGYLSEVGYSSNLNAYTKLLSIKERNLADQLRVSELFSTSGTPVLTLTNDYSPAMGRPTALKGVDSAAATVFNLTYGYFKNGLISSRIDSVVGRTERYTYDDVGRLATWQATYGASNRTMAYEYSLDGNLMSVKLNGAYVEQNSYGQNGASPHALTTQILNNGSTSVDYTYDVRGRQTSGGGRTISSYSDLNLPKRVTKGFVSWDYSYDAFGNRAFANGSRTATYVLGLYEKRIESGATTHVFHVVGADGAIADLTRPDAGTKPSVSYLLSDALGSVAAVANVAGAVTNRLHFEPFGKRINVDGSPFLSAAGVIKHGFTGHEHDYELGLINMMGRVYDPQIKRFLTPDPVLLSAVNGQSLNGFSYVRNSPVNYTDPTGMWSKTSICAPAGDGFTDCDALSAGGGSSNSTPGGESVQGDQSWMNHGQKDHSGVTSRAGGAKAKNPEERNMGGGTKGAAPMQVSDANRQEETPEPVESEGSKWREMKGHKYYRVATPEKKAIERLPRFCSNPTCSRDDRPDIYPMCGGSVCGDYIGPTGGSVILMLAGGSLTKSTSRTPTPRATLAPDQKWQPPIVIRVKTASGEERRVVIVHPWNYKDGAEALMFLRAEDEAMKLARAGWNVVVGHGSPLKDTVGGLTATDVRLLVGPGQTCFFGCSTAGIAFDYTLKNGVMTTGTTSTMAWFQTGLVDTKGKFGFVPNVEGARPGGWVTFDHK